MNAILRTVIIVVVVVAVILAGLAAASCLGGTPSITGGGVFRLKVSDPEYTALLEGKKTVEARIDHPPFNRLSEGDPIVVIRSRPQGDTSEYPGGRYKYDTKVAKIVKYKNITDLFKAEKIGNVYPGKSDKEATELFERYLPEGKSSSDAVLAVHLAKPSKTAMRSGFDRESDF